MAILSDKDIRELLRERDDPFITNLGNPDVQIGSCSVDLRLDGRIINDKTNEEIWNQDTVTFEPGVPYLATTIERLDLPRDICADIKGRSSIGRKFVQVHEAGWVDAGYPGQVTLEVINHRDEPQEFPVGTRFCQAVFHETKSEPETAYPEKDSQKYANQTGPTPSRLYEEQD